MFAVEVKVNDESLDPCHAHVRALERENDELREVHADLERARDQYLDMYRLAPIAFLTLDRAGTIVDANVAAGTLFGSTRAQLTGCRLRNFAERSGVGALERHLARVFDHGTRQIAELALQAFDGGQLTVRLHTEVERGALVAGRCRVAVVDITEDRRREAAQLQLQAELRDREARLSAILRTMTDAVVILDERRVVEQFGPASERMFQICAEAIVGRPFTELFDGDQGIRGDGARFPAEVRVHAMDLPGPERYVALVRDLTEQRQWTEALLRSQKLEALGRLATGIAHDYANLFMGLGCGLDLALRHVPSGSPAQPYLERCVATVQRGAGLCKQLKSFGCPGNAEHRRVDVDAMISETVALLRPVLGDGYEVRWDGGATGAAVIADPGRLEQVVLNLALNARDAMPTGGVVELSSAIVSRREPGASFFELCVRDAGTGIAPDKLARIFEPFFTTKAHGTGLGLMMVKQTIDQLGGEIELDSAPGDGTRVSIRVPLAPPALASALVVPAERPPGRVLVVDDDLAVLAAMGRHLEHLGWEVEAVNDPGVALGLCRDPDARYDVVVTDVMMPTIDGGVLARVIHERHAALPVVFMSGRPLAEHVAAGTLPAGSRLLQKPVAMAALVAELDRVLS